jgi:type IV pilus assembly protein PilM
MRSEVSTSRWLSPSPPTVAVEIAARRVTVVELSGGAQPAVSAYATEGLPSDAVTPALTGINISKPGVVADALRVALDRAGLRSPRRAALVVPDGCARVSLQPFEQVPQRAADLEKLLRWQLRKAMPFPIDEAQLTFFSAHRDPAMTTLAAVVARRDVIAQYEAVAASLGIHAGIVDLSSFNVMNALMGGATGGGDRLLVCLAVEGTTLAILRDDALMFYRHRATVDEEPLSALVHQTAMFHQDRLGGSRFAQIWLSGAATSPGGADSAREELTRHLGVPAELVDVRTRATLSGATSVPPAVLDALAAPVGVLLRERKAA